MKYQGLLPDHFYEVETASEDQAQRKMLAKLREDLDKPGMLDRFIVWEEPSPVSEAVK